MIGWSLNTQKTSALQLTQRVTRTGFITNSSIYWKIWQNLAGSYWTTDQWIADYMGRLSGLYAGMEEQRLWWKSVSSFHWRAMVVMTTVMHHSNQVSKHLLKTKVHNI